MTASTATLTCLEEKHCAAVLLFLLEHGAVRKSEIYREISTNPRMPQKLQLLQGAGLLTMTVDRFDNNSTTVRLTDDGRQTAELLYDCLMVMEHRPRRYSQRCDEKAEPADVFGRREIPAGGCLPAGFVPDPPFS